MSRETSVQEWLNKAESDRDTAKYPSIFQKPLAESAIQKTDQVFEWFLPRINFDKE